MLAICKAKQAYVVGVAKFIQYLYATNKLSKKHTYMCEHQQLCAS